MAAALLLDDIIPLVVAAEEKAIFPDAATDSLAVGENLSNHAGMSLHRFGCGVGLCGACTVHIDGGAERSCVTPMSAAAGKRITTIEGLSPNGDHPMQRAWQACNVPQCGYCQPGQIMQAAALLKAKPKPTDAEIDSAMQGNICRCGTYQRIRQAIKQAAGVKA